MSKKRQWTKPQLIVLARGTPEEAVLAACKEIEHPGSFTPGDPTSAAQTACNRGEPNITENCGACQNRSGS